jgi:glycosyltransferase involved in cell wall biosynthesis
MTRLHYISPSLIPSRSANSIHVIHQCHGFSMLGVNITLYAKRATASSVELPLQIQSFYGVDVTDWDIVTFHSNFLRADTLRIALMAIRPVLRASCSDLILSRNLYAAYIIAAFRRSILFETHQIENGIRGLMQRWILTRPWVRTIAVSERLVTCLEEHHAVRLHEPVVLHDAAPDGIKRLEPEERRYRLAGLLDISAGDLKKWNMICGYFGQLYAGRGIEVIEAMACARPSSLFLVFGGSDAEVASRRMNAPPNLLFMGHVTHQFARAVQAAVDVLLMPYQQNVSIGVKGHDTARWMSPMKMFEYLAAGVPIISSNLPVLNEILADCQNSLLVPPDNIGRWVAALDSLTTDANLANSIGETAHRQYLEKHTWTLRAQSLLVSGNSL